MTTYEESEYWCQECAKGRHLKYRASLKEGGEKYFASKEEAQQYFSSDIPKPYTEVTLVYDSSKGKDFVEVMPQYK